MEQLVFVVCIAVSAVTCWGLRPRGTTPRADEHPYEKAYRKGGPNRTLYMAMITPGHSSHVVDRAVTRAIATRRGLTGVQLLEDPGVAKAMRQTAARIGIQGPWGLLVRVVGTTTPLFVGLAYLIADANVPGWLKTIELAFTVALVMVMTRVSLSGSAKRARQRRQQQRNRERNQPRKQATPFDPKPKSTRQTRLRLQATGERPDEPKWLRVVEEANGAWSTWQDIHEYTSSLPDQDVSASPVLNAVPDDQQ